MSTVDYTHVGILPISATTDWAQATSDDFFSSTPQSIDEKLRAGLVFVGVSGKMPAGTGEIWISGQALATDAAPTAGSYDIVTAAVRWELFPLGPQPPATISYRSDAATVEGVLRGYFRAP